MSNATQLNAFRALANRRRLQLIGLLASHRELSLSGAASAIRLSVKSTHKHLSQLAQAGFITSERRGIVAYYRLEPQSDLAHRLLQLVRR